MIIDAHAHFEPRMLEEDRAIAKMDAAGIDKVVLIPAMNDPLPETPERLLAAVRFLLQRRALRPLAEAIHRATLTAEGDLRLHGQVCGIYARPDNAAVAAALRRRPDRFLGWVFLNPRNNPRVLDELEEHRSTPGIIGVKLHPHWHDYRTAILGPLLARCEELGLPVLVHLGFGARGDYRAMAEAHPRVRFLFAHAGMPFFDELWRFARTRDNVFVDLSSPYLDEPLVRRTVATLGPDRCLYGTDAPYGFPGPGDDYDYGRIRGWVERLPLPSREREKILGDNFLGLLR